MLNMPSQIQTARIKSVYDLREGNPKSKILHTHKPFYKELAEENGGRYRHAINIGSVGKPKDGDPRACYVMLEVNENTRMDAPGSVKVEFIRVKYDVEKAAKAVEDSPLPDEYGEMLRKAY